MTSFLISIFCVAKCGKGGVVGFPRMVEGLISLLHVLLCFAKETLYLLIVSICVLIVDT